MKLIHKASGREVQIGNVVNVGGIDYDVTYIPQPHKAAPSGKVTGMDKNGNEVTYYASSWGMEWIQSEDQGWKPRINKPTKIEHRIMRLLKERNYVPEIARGGDGFWLISFKDEEGTVHTVTAETNISDLWWLS